MLNRMVKKIAVMSLITCLISTNVFAIENDVYEELGIEKVYYPEINDKVGANSYYTRLEYGMSEGTGAGINLLVLNYEGEMHSAINNTRALYEYIIPNSKVTHIDVGSTTYKNLAEIITEELITENQIICISKFNYRDMYLYNLVVNHPDKYFIINGENPSIMDPLFNTYIHDLSRLDNTLIVAGSSNEGIDKEIISKDILKWVDIFVQAAPTSKEKANEYMYHSVYNESGRMDNALAVAASSLAILLENHVSIGDLGDYYKKNAKQRALSIQYNKYSFEPKTDYTIPVLDYKILFKKENKDNFLLKTYNIPQKYKGDNVKIGVLSLGNEEYGAVKDRIKSVIRFPKDYKPSTNTKEDEKWKMDVIKEIAPNAEVILLSAKSDVVNGELDVSYTKEALDWILKNSDKMDILAISAPIELQKDKSLLEKINQIGNKGIIVSWTWMTDSYSSNSNIITPCEYEGKKRHTNYLQLGEDLKLYDRFLGNFDMNNEYKWGSSILATESAALTALLEQADPAVIGTEIKSFYKNMSVEIDNEKELGLPDMRRIITLLENHLTYGQDFPIAASEITINFNKATDVKINGISYKRTKTVTVPFNTSLSIAIDQNNERIAEGTQLVDLDVFEAEDGTTYIDSTFNGKIVTDIGEMPIVRGLNKLSNIRPNAARGLTINYNMK